MHDDGGLVSQRHSRLYSRGDKRRLQNCGRHCWDPQRGTDRLLPRLLALFARWDSKSGGHVDRRVVSDGLALVQRVWYLSRLGRRLFVREFREYRGVLIVVRVLHLMGKGIRFFLQLESAELINRMKSVLRSVPCEFASVMAEVRFLG